MDIVVDSNLNGVANETKGAIYRMTALNLQKGATHALQNHKQEDKRAQAPEAVTAGISPISLIKRHARFENLTGAYAFVTDLRADPGEQSRPLRVATVVDVEAAMYYLRAVIAPYFLIPGLIELGRSDPHFAIIAQQLHTDIDALVANIPGMPFKESRDLAFSQSAERTPQYGPAHLRDQAGAKFRMRRD